MILVALASQPGGLSPRRKGEGLLLFICPKCQATPSDPPLALHPPSFKICTIIRDKKCKLHRQAHCACRLDALTNISRSYEGSQDPPGPTGILNSAAKFEELADVMYFWALAEAYLQHPQMQQDMR